MKSKRYSIVAPSKDTPEPVALQIMSERAKDKTNDLQTFLSKAYHLEKRYLDLSLWQSIERT